MLEIRKAISADTGQIWKIIQQIILKGDTYVFDPESTKGEMLAYWCGQDKHTCVAIENDKIVGTFFIKDNQPGLGSHIANAAYMTLPAVSGQGIGKTMGEFSLEEAKRLGYKAMQFNMVIKSNERALRLWEKLEFKIVGEIPEAFNHKQNGLTNAYILYRKL